MAIDLPISSPGICVRVVGFDLSDDPVSSVRFLFPPWFKGAWGRFPIMRDAGKAADEASFSTDGRAPSK